MPDLWWWPSPVTRRQARSAGLDIGVGDDDLPVTGLTRPQAAELAAALGGRLPTSPEWEWMAGGGRRLYPWGDTEPTSRHANLRDLGPGRPTAVDAHPDGASPDGLIDVAGNVWEWTSTSVPGCGAVVRGGSYQSLTLYARCAFSNEIPDSVQSPGIGMRVVRTPVTTSASHAPASGMRAPADPILSRLVIVPCCARKTATTMPVAALDLYQDGPVPKLRERLGAHPRYRQRIRILSAQHGVVDADTFLLPYDRPLDEVRAQYLRPQVTQRLHHDAQFGLVEALIMADPLYLTLVADLLAEPTLQVHWVRDPFDGWTQVAAVLDSWGWP